VRQAAACRPWSVADSPAASIAQGGLDLICGRILGREPRSTKPSTRACRNRGCRPVGNRNEGLQPLRDLDNVRSLGSMGPARSSIAVAAVLSRDLLWPLAARRHRLAGAVILVTLTLITEFLSRTPAKRR
jgi:ATP-binding cassette subfamily C protein